MDRREFIARTVAAGAVIAAAPAVIGGCAGARARPEGGERGSIDALLESGPRVMWIAAHPDDEALLGAIFAKSSLALGNPLYFLVLTHGDGGECCRPEGCRPDLATIRAAELKQVAAWYRAELQHERYWNAPLPVESFPKRHEIARRWAAERDPVPLIATAIRNWRPDVVFSFSPDHGFTGHPEHQLASRFATAGIRLAAADDPRNGLGDLKPHRVAHVFFGLNRYWPFRALGAADPGPVTDVFDAAQPCAGGKTCRDFMAEFSRAHRSQANDMGTVRSMKRWIDRLYLRRTDPWSEIKDPFEPVA